jgi:uracil-DNA glycosylase
MSNLPADWPADSDWTPRLSEAFASESFESLMSFVQSSRDSQTVFPPSEEVYTAFRETSFADTKVVILGQDPYHGAGQAHGLSFSVKASIKHPPSLRNIFKELSDDFGVAVPESGNLLPWSRQGVLLLNTVLTVQESQANSHRKKGWEQFTDSVIQSLNDHPNPLVFILWGSPAQKKEKLIDARHCLIKSVHPSPLSAHRGFFGSKPFSQANEFLAENGVSTIDWRIE